MKFGPMLFKLTIAHDGGESVFEGLYSEFCKREEFFFLVYLGRPEAKLGTEIGIGKLGGRYFC